MPAAIASTIAPPEAFAQSQGAGRYDIDITARTLREAIVELSGETGSSIGTDGALPDFRTPRIKGRMRVAEALARLLKDSGYRARQVGASAWRIERERRVDRPANRTAPSVQPPPPAARSVARGPIIVTAAKSARDLQTLPLSLNSVDPAEDGPLLPTVGTQWLAGGIEGLALTASGSGRNRMFLRGVADSPFNGESQSTVAVLVDDARVTFAAPDPDIRLVDIDRVEVLKGPQGSLYGIGALGGIYQIRTRRPELGRSSFEASAGVESVAGGGVGAGGTAIANLPLAQGSAAVRLVGYGMREAGWIDTGSRENGNSLRVSGARIGLGVEPSADWRFDLSGMMQRINSADSQYVFSPGARSRPPQLAERHDSDFTMVSLHTAGETDIGHLELDSAYTWHEVHETYDATVGAEVFGIADPRLLLDQRDYRVWDSEVRLNGSSGDSDWLLGLSHLTAWQELLTRLEAGSIAQPAVLDDDRRKASETALLGNISMPLGARFRLELGARLFFGTIKDTRILAGVPVSRDRHQFGTTPSLSLAYEPRAGRNLFVHYGSAYRQGGVEISPGGELESFNGDELEALELGWREALPADGQVELNFYATLWNDMQADMLEADRLIETRNVGKGRILGVEASWKQRLGGNWAVAAGAAVTSARLIRNESGIDLEDTRLPVVPGFTVRASLTHGFTIGNADARVGFQLRYLGPARLSFEPALDRKMGDVLESRLTASAAFDGFELAFEIENLLGRADDTFAFGNQLRIFSGYQFTPLRPRTMSLSVSRRF